MHDDPNLADLGWLDPSRPVAPQESLARIRAMCQLLPTLDGAMLAVVATHPSVPREVLASAIQRFRPDADQLSQKDVVNLLVALVNGGRQGFEAVMRTRKTAKPLSGALPWVRE